MMMIFDVSIGVLKRKYPSSLGRCSAESRGLKLKDMYGPDEEIRFSLKIRTEDYSTRVLESSRRDC